MCVIKRFLTEELIPSFLITGQQNPAFGRKIADCIEVADGSRRRMTAILTSNEYCVLVGDLDDAQKDSLCKIGTRAYDRGKCYSFRQDNEFNCNISALAAAAENISRKIITRCINTAKIPRYLIAISSHSGELPVRTGDNLNRLFNNDEVLLIDKISELSKMRKSGIVFETVDIIQALNDTLKTSKGSKSLSPVKKESVLEQRRQSVSR